MKFRVVYRAFFVVSVIASCVSFCAIFRIFFPGPISAHTLSFFCRLLCKAIGIDCVVDGSLDRRNVSTAFVSNHMSYIDIVVIGSVVPARFISKSDVRNWPIIGWLSGMFGTIFVDRKPSSTRASVANICNAVNNRDNVVLFPEGTTSDGCRILPFKSSFFKLPRECVIQPIFLEYKEFNGFPAKRADKKNYSWIGAETAMLPHLIRIMETRRVKACVRILPVISQTESCCDRKALADLSHKSLLSASRGVHI